MTFPRWFFAAACVAALPLAASAQTHATVIGGAPDGRLYATFLDLQTGSSVFNTGFTGINAVAHNSVNDTVYYRTTSGGALWSWQVGGNTQTQVPATLPGASADASVYNNAYWYVQDGTDTLTRVDLASFAVTTYANFDGASRTSFNWGDIAITSAGVLYGQPSNTFFFSVDISGLNPTVTNGGATSNFTQSNVAGSDTSLQIAYGADNLLYAQATNSRQWYTINNGNTGTPAAPSANFGARSTINGFVTTGQNDITNVFLSTLASVAVPEPGSLPLLVPAVSFVGAAVLCRCRRGGSSPR